MRSSRLVLVQVSPDSRRRGRRTARRSTAARAVAVASGRPAASQRARRRRAAELGGQVGQLAQLQDEERGEVGGLDDAVGVEGGGVVPAAVVAVLVVRPACCPAPGGAVEPEPGPARPAAGTLRRAPRRSRLGMQVPAQLPQRPAVDRWLDEVVEDLGVGDRVGQRAGRVLVVERRAGTGPRPAPARRRRGRGR